MALIEDYLGKIEEKMGDALGGPGSRAETLEDALRANAEVLVAGLGAGPTP